MPSSPLCCKCVSGHLYSTWPVGMSLINLLHLLQSPENFLLTLASLKSSFKKYLSSFFNCGVGARAARWHEFQVSYLYFQITNAIKTTNDGSKSPGNDYPYFLRRSGPGPSPTPDKLEFRPQRESQYWRRQRKNNGHINTCKSLTNLFCNGFNVSKYML